MNNISFLLIWGISAYGMSNIIVYGSIFENFREWLKRNIKFFGDLVSCMMCTSTWVGFFMSFVFDGFIYRFMEVSPIWGFFFDGMLTSGLVWIINTFVEHFEK